MADPLGIYTVRDEAASPFGVPGGNDTFGEFLKGLHEASDPNAEARSQIDMAEKFQAGVTAAYRKVHLAEGINSNFNAMAEAADHRIRTVQEQTGVVLENPFRNGYFREASERVTNAGGEGNIQDNRYQTIIAEQRKIFDERIDEVTRQFPDKAKALQFFQPVEAQAHAIAQGAEHDGEHADLLPSLVGGFGAAMRDPVQAAALLASGGESLAGTALARIGWTALRQGLLNAGISAVEQPAVQQWRSEAGLRNGVVPGLENVGMNFVFGAIAGGVIHGGIELVRADRAALARVAEGLAKPGDIETAAKALGVKIDADTAATIKAAEADQAHAALARADAPEGLPPGLVGDVERQALRHAEDPAHEPPPMLASRPEVKPDVPQAEATMARFDAAPLDGVEALRRDPRLVEGALHSESPGMAQAGRLAALSDQAWSMVRTGRATPEHGIIVGELSPDPAYDASVLARLADARPETAAEARLIAADAIEGESRRLEATLAARRESSAGRPENSAGAAPEKPQATPEAPQGQQTPSDVIDLVPLLREDGTVMLLNREQAAALADRETGFADLVRSCAA